jgi:hypothetical protein
MLEPSAGVGSARFVQEFVEFHFVSEKRPRSLVKLIYLLISSHLTTTIRCPLNNSLATIEASLPKRCPFPSIITNFSNIKDLIFY